MATSGWASFGARMSAVLRRAAHLSVSGAAACAVVLIAGCAAFDRDPTAKWDAEKLYAEARQEREAGNWVRYRELLEKLESRYPFGRYAQQAQIDIAYSYYKQGEFADAITACDRFLRLNPNHQAVDYALYLKGLSTFNDDLGLFGRFFGVDPSRHDPKSMREAFDIFKELVLRFPDSKYAADATARMNYLVNALASNEVHVARYYYQRGAYLAAIQRAQAAVRDYGGTPAAEEAMYLVMRSYQGLGMEDLRADAERVLQKNYPNSRFLK